MNTSLTTQSSSGLRRDNRPWFQPSVNIFETENELVLEASLPGVTAKDLDVNFEPGVLTIHGHVESPVREGWKPLLSEYAIGDYHRTFRLGETIDVEKIAAEFADGVLTLHLPKIEAAKPKKIAIQVK